MNLSGLERLGKVAGIAGISIGAVVLLLNALIGTIPGLPVDQQPGIVKLLAILCFGMGVTGILAWLASGRYTKSGRPVNVSVSTTGHESPAIKAGGNVDISFGGAVPEQAVASRPSQPTTSSSGTTVQTLGDQSPAVDSGGDTAVRYRAGASTENLGRKRRG
jgi:hypothetical protein